MDAKKKKNLEETYERILNVGFCLVPYEDLSDITGPDPMVYGTAKDERILSFEGVEALFKSQYEQVGNMKPAIDRKRIALRISNGGNNACIIEEITFTLSSEEEIHTIFMRATCVMEYLDNQWKLTHWHTSTPVDTENDPWHMEEWKREKEKLQQLVDEQTADLQKKNQELQIEAALERVRAMTMAMHSSDDVGKCVVKMFGELTALGVDEGTRFGIGILNHDNENNQLWTARKNGDEVKMHIGNIDMASHPLLKSARQAWKEQVPLHQYVLEGEDLLDYYQMLNSAPGYKIQIPIEKLPKKEIQHCFIFEHGFFYAFSPREFQPELIQITKRFSALFEQTYRRYLDLVKAEAQAREAQIEAALERVRGRTMAMHKSEELSDAGNLLFHQLRELGIEAETSWLWFIDVEKNEVEIWTTHENKLAKPIRIDPVKLRTVQQEVEAWKNEVPTVKLKILGSEAVRAIKDFFGIEINYQENSEHFHLLQIRHDYGFLGLGTWKEASENEIKLYSRFAKVFEQTYTRFLDLQKAEAQAREAQIEAALERVRSASMAMHQTEDIGSVVQVYFEQLKHLDIPFEQAWITILHLEEGYFDTWFSPIDGIYDKPTHFKMPSAPFEETAIKNWKSGVPFSYLSLKKKSEVDQFLFACDEMTNSKYFSHIQKKLKIERLEFLEARHKFGFLSKTTLETPAKEDEDILLRFASVFEQTYTRFLDIQKAEAQAREANIEAALERIRAKSMAMYQSNELHQVVLCVSQEITNLGMNIHGTHLYRWDENDLKGLNVWFAAGDGISPNEVYWPYFKHTVFDGIEDARRKGKTFFTVLLDKKEKNRLYLHLNTKTSIVIPEERKNFALEAKGAAYSLALGKHAGIAIFRFTNEPFSSEENEILQRFTNVFEQAFTRFHDLKKAEAQAREAQIQLSLERVRARSLAMQSSDELHDVLSVLFRQFDNLGIQPVNVFLSLFDRKNRTLTYRASGKSGTRAPGKQVVEVDSMKPLQALYDKWINDNSDSVEVIFYPKEVLPDLFGIFADTFAPMPEEDRMGPADFPEGGYSMAGYTPFGYLGYDHQRQATDEEKDILSRFCLEFTRVYQRFLDIQKAEAQSREAQIQLSLERVRARSMAMQSSDELSDVLSILFQQFDELGIKPLNVWLSLYNLEENIFIYRATGTGGTRIQGQQVIDINAMDIWKDSVEQWKSGHADPVLVTFYPPEVLPQLMEVFKETFDVMPEEERMDPKLFPEGGYNVQGYTKFGYIGYNHLKPPTQEEKDILRKFATEFERVYQRFLDIEKAEAQAREAQIETALERVRARSMAMHQTDELNDVLCVLLEQFDFLGINPVLTHLTLFDEANGKFSLRLTTSPTSRILVEQIIDIYAVESWKASYENWKKGVPNTVDCIDYPPEVLPAVWEVLSEVMNALPEGHKINPEDFPDGLFTTQGHFKFGYLGFNHRRKATAEEKTLVSRFATEFGRAYQRFLDIQKAEAQVKEAQIEAALEKVRSRSLGMQNTKEMQLVANEIREQLLSLGVSLDAMAMSGVIDNEADYDVWVGGAISEKPLRIAYNNDTQVQRDYNNVIKERPELFMKTYSGKIMKEYFKQLMDTNSFNPEIEKFMKECSAFTTTLTFMKNSGIQIIRYTAEPFSNSDNQIVIRFGKVFEQAYIRFLDLQKAEAQAREARIEAALEKVRSRTMGMQSSSELPEVANLLFLEVQGLGVPSWSSGFNVLLEDKKSANAWMSSEGTIQEPFVLRLWGEASFDEMGGFIKSKETFMVQELGGNALVEHYNYMKSFPDLQPTFEKLEIQGLSLPTYQINHLCTFSNGFLLFITYEQVPEAHNIFKRFTKVFDQTYTRFLDLERAEAQAREARIEAALERIRSHSMGMQSTSDFGVVTTEIFDQLRNFGEDLFAAGIVFCDKHEGHVEQWHSIPGGGMLSPFIVPVDLDYIHQYRYNQWKAGKELFSIEIPSDFIEQHFKDIFDLPSAQIALKDLESRNAPMPAAPSWEIDYGASFKNGYILISSLKHLETTDILPRFARVFEQAYTRFLDLQKAEAQAREAKIETALERVRSRTMAMHKSEELGKVANVLFEQISTLTYAPERFNIAIADKEKESFDIWVTDQKGHELSKRFLFQVDRSPVVREVFNAWQTEPYLVQDLHGKKLQEWVHYFREEAGIPFDKTLLSEHRYINSVFFSHGCIGITTNEPPEAEVLELIGRFAKVFDQTYTRFLDLKKAEAQARDAQIEAALERIRSRAMAMQTSEELKDVAQELRTQMGLLGQKELEVCAIHLYEEHKDHFESWAAMHLPGEEGSLIQTQALFPKSGKLIIDEMMDCYVSEQNEYVLVNEGKKAEQWFELLKENTPDAYDYIMKATANIPVENMKAYWAMADFSGGALVMVTYSYPDEDSRNLLRRTATVFGLAYKRFKDLRLAEASARAALQQASLDRVRADISSMRHAEDLNRVTPLVFNELTTLGIPFIRCGVFIVHEKEKNVEIYLSTPEGKSLAAMTLPFDSNEMTARSVEAWKKEEVYVQHWSQADFVSWSKSLAEQGFVKDLKTYQGAETAPQSLHLHFIPFSQGLLYVGSTEMLAEVQIKLVIDLAKSFEIAYARYEDFVRLERAKAEVESAMLELKATQSQLIQSEKMASLGELTAGIAHEIQNPLNFVNNFSEVSNELLDEMNEELIKGEVEEAKLIANDVKQNLEKILHHGKRADGIVKGMLQHSRSSSGTKEPTDINALADEYLRLAYHGLRAKDKSFNAKFESRFDESIGKIEVVPQDIGRVILNLITNAFYVVNEKSKQGIAGYEPTVSVSTKKEGNAVLISVQDNGNGIPDSIKEKIFQPFFTTKPTGQGTGLGLSLAYDIVKAHGGELTVESNQNEGTNFTIKLPIS